MMGKDSSASTSSRWMLVTGNFRSRDQEQIPPLDFEEVLFEFGKLARPGHARELTMKGGRTSVYPCSLVWISSMKRSKPSQAALPAPR